MHHSGLCQAGVRCCLGAWPPRCAPSPSVGVQGVPSPSVGVQMRMRMSRGPVIRPAQVGPPFSTDDGRAGSWVGQQLGSSSWVGGQQCAFVRGGILMSWAVVLKCFSQSRSHLCPFPRSPLPLPQVDGFVSLPGGRLIGVGSAPPPAGQSSLDWCQCVVRFVVPYLRASLRTDLRTDSIH